MNKYSTINLSDDHINVRIFEYSNIIILLSYSTVLYCILLYWNQYSNVRIRIFEYYCITIHVCSTLLYCIVSYSTVLNCSVTQYCTVLYSNATVLLYMFVLLVHYCTYFVLQYSTALYYSTVLYRIVLYYCTDLLNTHVVSIWMFAFECSVMYEHYFICQVHVDTSENLNTPSESKVNNNDIWSCIIEILRFLSTTPV